MMLNWFLGLLLLIGHLALFVVIINTTHALGLDEGKTTLVKVSTLSALLGIAAVGGWLVGSRPWSDWHVAFRFYGLVCLGTALVGLPVVTLARAFRRMPDGITGRVTEIDLAEREGRENLIGTGRHSSLLRLPGNQSLRLHKLEWDVRLPGLPAACDGLRIVQFTDLHLAPTFGRRFFEAVIDEAAAWDADLVLFTGDLVDHDDCVDWVAPLLSRVRGRLGSFGIMGNHDYAHDPERIRRAIREAGFTDLEGRWASLEVDGTTLALGGTSAPWGPSLDPDAMPEADFRILLSHSPDLLGKAARWGIDLMLSGHNHGGQIRLPLIGPVFMPSLYSRRYDRGFFRAGPTLLHVSQGVGGKHPVRYGCIPEMSQFVLRVARPAPYRPATPARIADSAH